MAGKVLTQAGLAAALGVGGAWLTATGQADPRAVVAVGWGVLLLTSVGLETWAREIRR